jgi:hypothetical protein
MNTQQINHKELGQITKHYYDKGGIGLFCMGRTGIGKSYVIKDVAKQIAILKGKEFIEWNNTSEADKVDIANNIEKQLKSFIFMDMRLTESEPSDIKGLPFVDNGYVVWKKNLCL